MCWIKNRETSPPPRTSHSLPPRTSHTPPPRTSHTLLHGHHTPSSTDITHPPPRTSHTLLHRHHTPSSMDITHPPPRTSHSPPPRTSHTSSTDITLPSSTDITHPPPRTSHSPHPRTSHTLLHGHHTPLLTDITHPAPRTSHSPPPRTSHSGWAWIQRKRERKWPTTPFPPPIKQLISNQIVKTVNYVLFIVFSSVMLQEWYRLWGYQKLVKWKGSPCLKYATALCYTTRSTLTREALPS